MKQEIRRLNVKNVENEFAYATPAFVKDVVQPFAMYVSSIVNENVMGSY